ncbi:Golgi integral membrane protein 4-like isoform X3 [Scyliorhinus canicula]|uniref:Golgi integral membrane protein 4-like isoform X3 n=1 Tax=Scyliorhinus canicula TaxID=7830 RepID=UPI0018F4E14A|nr:Golgi integral membrane protein 4-like isoform X3 [Scyliorhinus canicula]
MGNSMCSRRQKKIFQTLFFLTIVFGFLYGLLLYYEMHNQLKKAETLASKYQQHQEALSAQLQVVYEHRSRLEKSLQKERNEHKKAKEDYLVYKLEAQEALNKEKQDSSNRYGALNVQHKMLKNQHEDLRKQYTDLHGEQQRLGEDHNRAMNEHSRRYLSLQQEKEQEIAKLKENIYNVFEENKKLRKAHQDVHVQLQDVRQLHKNLLLQHDQLQVNLEDHKNSLSAAQAQVEEYKQLRETLNKMPSLRQTEQKPPPNVEQSQQGVAEPIQYHNKLGTQDQIPYRSEGDQHDEVQMKTHKSPYEQQLEQQRLAQVRAEESRKLKERQDALHQQRLREYMDRQERLQHEAAQKEELLRQEQSRHQSDFNNDEAAEGDDERDVREEEEEVEDENNPHDEAEDEDPEIVNEDHHTQHETINQQIGGNPDQQEDNLDEQYQDEGEEEVDEKEGEANEQEEEAVADDANQEGVKEDENYEEEEDEEERDVPAAKTNRRAEM